MPAKVTMLDREIAKEERVVGIPSDQPLTDRAIVRRRVQIAILVCTCGLVALYALAAAAIVVQMTAIALAGFFGVYAIEQDRHLRRLASLRGDSQRIRLVVAGELLYSGVLAGDRELLDLRDGVGRSAGALAAALSDVLPADCTRVRLVGPSGELPVAAQREIAPSRPVPDDASIAREALRVSAPVRRDNNGHSTMAVPMWRGDDAIGLLEVISPQGDLYQPVDTAVVDAFARGVVAALRSR
jgi:hypothetical protein